MRTFKVLLDLTTIWFMRRYQTKPIYLFGGLGVLMFLGAFVISGVRALREVRRRRLGAPQSAVPDRHHLLAHGRAVVGTGILAELIVRTYFESQGKTAYSIASRAGFPPDARD